MPKKGVSLWSRLMDTVGNVVNPEPKPALFSSDAYKNIEATWGDFVSDVNGWDSVEQHARDWLGPVIRHILYCDSCKTMKVSASYQHVFGCRAEAYHIGVGRLLEIAVEKDCIGAIRFLKRMDVLIRPDEYIKSLQWVLKHQNRIPIIEIMDWRWFWSVLVRCDNSSLTRDGALSGYLAYVHEMLGAMFCSNEDSLDIQNLAHAGQVLGAILPKKDDDTLIWLKFMQLMDKIDFLTPIGTQEGGREVRRILEEDFGVLWRPSTRILSRGQREVMIDLAKKIIRKNVGMYSPRQLRWLRLVQRCSEVQTAIRLEVMVLGREIRQSADSVGEQHIKRSSLESVCPNLGVGPSWWERVRYRYFSCFSRRPKAKKSHRSWVRYIIPCVRGRREYDEYDEQLLPPKAPSQYRWGRADNTACDDHPRIADTPF